MNTLIQKALYSRVVRNIAALYVIQFAGYVLPVVTVPYLARVLGPTGWGLVVLTQSFSLWTTLVLDFGFNFSATRDVARIQGDPQKVALVAAGVMGAKLGLSLLLIVPTAVAGLVVPAFTANPLFLVFAAVQTFAAGFSPLWFFQGTERMSRSAVTDILTRGAGTLGVFLVVHTPGDAWLVPALQSAGSCVATGLLLTWMYKEIPWVAPTFRATVDAARAGWSLFLFRGALSLYTTANAFLLGLFVAPSEVAIFGGADKVARVGLSLLGPVGQAIYPRMNQLMAHDPGEAGRLLRLNLKVTGGLGLVLGAGICFYGPSLVGIFLGPDYAETGPVLRILALLIPLSAVSNIFGVHWLVPLGLERYLNRIILGAGALNIIVATVVARRFGPIGMAWSVIAAEVVVLLATYTTLVVTKVNPFRAGASAATTTTRPSALTDPVGKRC